MLKYGKCSENGINPKAVYDFLDRCEREDLGVNSFMLIKYVAPGVLLLVEPNFRIESI